MVEPETKPSLRERKRRQTLSDIEQAAVELVLRDGLAATTVDAIAERAGISRRTFFNYFDGKDAAILGLTPDVDGPSIDPVDGEEPLLTVIRALMRGMGHRDRTVLHRQRLGILKEHPEVLSSQFAQLHAHKDRMGRRVTEFLATRPEFADDPDLEVRAQVVLAVCSTCVRSAVQEQTESTPEELPDDLDEVIAQRALTLARTTLEMLR